MPYRGSYPPAHPPPPPPTPKHTHTPFPLENAGNGKTWTGTFRTLANSAEPNQMRRLIRVCTLHCLLKLQEVTGFGLNETVLSSRSGPFFQPQRQSTQQCSQCFDFFSPRKHAFWVNTSMKTNCNRNEIHSLSFQLDNDLETRIKLYFGKLRKKK